MKRFEIEERATSILRDHGLLRAPVDPLKIAKALNVKVLNAVFSEENKSGAIAKRGGNFQIFVNANDSPARKRFTIAHEIGHQLLHMSLANDSEFVDTEDNFRTNSLTDDAPWSEERQKEYEANAFAAALLMNSTLVQQEWLASKDPNFMAWKFQVSPSAMAIRLNQLGLLNTIA
jgi:Zn-dependent peptidase ImmA (M78 family)